MCCLFQGGGQVQEQRAGDEQPEAPPVLDSVRKVQRKNRVGHQRGSESLENRAPKSRHCYFKVKKEKRKLFVKQTVKVVNRTLKHFS